jgi:hypothetical protein
MLVATRGADMKLPERCRAPIKMLENAGRLSSCQRGKCQAHVKVLGNLRSHSKSLEKCRPHTNMLRECSHVAGKAPRSSETSGKLWAHVRLLGLFRGHHKSPGKRRAHTQLLGQRRYIRGAQTAFILFSTFLDLRPASDASD